MNTAVSARNIHTKRLAQQASNSAALESTEILSSPSTPPLPPQSEPTMPPTKKYIAKPMAACAFATLPMYKCHRWNLERSKD
mmetsp:Transcript_15261/g.23204  ORF Transcript_15261/g.23204 Transcript_15261/m.23204 type:complete len:82 (-) Transcript_15261:54-299(-)